MKRTFLCALNSLSFLLSSLLVIAGCSTNTTQPPANGSQTAAQTNASPDTTSSLASQPGSPQGPVETALVKPKVDACALLTSKEIESVQGEATKETKLTGQATGGFSISQCFFSLAIFINSVSLLVAQKGEGAGANDPKEFWRDTFHRKKAEEREKHRDKKKGGEAEEEGVPPQRVPAIGDEAYWVGSRVGGALYVLTGNAYVRVSIGGPADQATKIKRSKALAQKALARLY